MRGMDWNDPCRIRTWKELVKWIKEVGFLPLFANEVKGFSAEEHVSPTFWWTGDREQDPWEWREILSTDLKKQTGFGKGGEKNYQGIITQLQMETYLVISDFRRRENKRGEEYGMAVSILLPPESVWGYDTVTAAYSERPKKSWERQINRVKELYPDADDQSIIHLLGKEPEE